MIPVALEKLVGESSLGCEEIVEGLGSGRYVGLDRDGLSGIFGPGEWPSNWGSGAWEVAGNSGQAGVTPEARAGLKTLSSLFRGRPVLSLGDLGVLQPGLTCLGLVFWVDFVGLYGQRVR